MYVCVRERPLDWSLQCKIREALPVQAKGIFGIGLNGPLETHG